MSERQLTFYEFFAGGGMARAGLGASWQCTFANDFDGMKQATYARNWGDSHFHGGDVARIQPSQIPGRADLSWASFPCQDLSLAGSNAGLGDAGSNAATRSGTFWLFWSLMQALRREERAPRAIVLENVYGALTSRGGADFAAIGQALSRGGYRFGAIVIDAERFVPQSRQRVFFVAIDREHGLDMRLSAPVPRPEWHPRALVAAYALLSAEAKKDWIWWNMPPPEARKVALSDLIEDEPQGVGWHSPSETSRLLSLMSPINLSKVETAKASGKREVGCIYRRTRPDANGGKQQRAEVRFDDIAGCLRTPAGGSSRQTILIVDGANVRSRLLSPREAARLMGLPDSYLLPARYNDAYHVAGDGVCVPVVRHLARVIVEPALRRPIRTFVAAE